MWLPGNKSIPVKAHVPDLSTQAKIAAVWHEIARPSVAEMRF